MYRQASFTTEAEEETIAFKLKALLDQSTQPSFPMASELAVNEAAKKLLKSNRHVIKYAGEVLEAPSGDYKELPETNRVQATQSARRYLSVITSLENGFEEAAIVVFRRPAAPLVVKMLPIYSNFQLSISQKLANHSPTSARERSRFRIAFSLPTSALSQYTIVSEDISPYANLIAEVKRLQEIAKAQGWLPGKGTHEWTSSYKEFDGTLDKEKLARFDSISTAYSMRISEPTAMRTGLTSIDWGGTTTSPTRIIAKEDEVANDERGKWIVKQLQEREEEFTVKEDIRIYCGTFNVNDKLPTEDLSPWLVPSEGAQLLVFGFQEFDGSTEAMVRYTPFREDQWRVAIEKGLGTRAEKYEKLHSRQLVGALIIIYVLKEVASNITSVVSNSIATGLLGLVANKGATAIRLRYKDSYLTFVNSHLAAFANMTEKRNQEMKDIGRLLVFPFGGGKKERDPWTPNCKPDAERPLGGLGIYDSHQLIWLGDLNYRVELPRTDVIRMIDSKEWDLLLRFDQLKISKQHALAWTEFEEARVTFPPTYKFDVGTHLYDTSEKARTPSWTDRILWLSLHEGSTKAISYTSHPEITLSDHKPVSAVLNVQVLSIIPEKRLKVQHEVMSELDMFDNDQLPDVKILPGPAVQFDSIDYLKPEVRYVEVKNVGRVIAQWGFVLKPGATTLSESWLHITPTSGLILPGEHSVVKLTISVDNENASALNFSSDENVLSDLLILSITKKDLFMAVQARDYRKTCFGNQLSQLAKLSKPIRLATPDELEAVAGSSKGEVMKEMESKGSVPREVWRMIDFLAAHALDLPNVFLSPGKDELIVVIRECLDTGDPFPLEVLLPDRTKETSLEESITDSGLGSEASESGDVDIGSVQLSPKISRTRPPPPASPSHRRPSTLDRPFFSAEDTKDELEVGIYSMADCLLRFLESLSEPVVTFSAYPKALRAEQRADAYRVLESLPPVNESTLLYLMAFLRVLVGRTTDVNERLARIDRLAVVFSSVLLRADPSGTPDSLPPASVPRRRKTFVLHLLSEDPTFSEETT